MHAIKPPAPRQQRGAALIVGLILLAVLMIIGVTSAISSMTEVKLASNAEDRSRAFHVAENTLRVAEERLNGLASTGQVPGQFTGGNIGLYKSLHQSTESQGGATPACLQDTPWNDDWTDANSVAVSAPEDSRIDNDSSAPRYMIGLDSEPDEESSCYSPPSTDGFSNALGRSGGASAARTWHLTITVLASGALPNTRVLLQEHYELVD